MIRARHYWCGHSKRHRNRVKSRIMRSRMRKRMRRRVITRRRVGSRRRSQRCVKRGIVRIVGNGRGSNGRRRRRTHWTINDRGLVSGDDITISHCRTRGRGSGRRFFARRANYFAIMLNITRVTAAYMRVLRRCLHGISCSSRTCHHSRTRHYTHITPGMTWNQTTVHITIHTIITRIRIIKSSRRCRKRIRCYAAVTTTKLARTMGKLLCDASFIPFSSSPIYSNSFYPNRLSQTHA